MQRYPRHDPYERHPLDDSYGRYDSSPPRHYDQPSPDRRYGAPNYYEPQQSRDLPSARYNDYAASNDANDVPMPRSHADHAYPSPDPFPRGAADGPAYPQPRLPNVTLPPDHSRAMAYTASDPSTPVPPPPSRALRPDVPRYPMSPYGAGATYDPYTSRGQNPVDHDSHSSLNPFGTPPTADSPSRSMNSFGRPNSLTDDPYQSYSSNPRHDGVDVGLVNPHDIEDDGDDGLSYARRPQRTSLFNRSDSGPSSRSGTRAAAVGAGAGASTLGLMSSNGPDGASRTLDAGASPEKSSAWLSQKKGHSKTCKWVAIVVVFLIIVGAIVGGVVGALVAGNQKAKGGGGTSALDDTKQNGDLDINSKEIKALMKNPNLHKVFPGMDYTPFNTQYPDCLGNPPSQNNVTRDVAVLSQLTNKIRLYGTDCNQTEMVIHAVKQLKLQKDIKIWLGVWQDKNETTNSRQLTQMWNILDDYGADPFEGLIVANEILFRKEMTISTLDNVLSDVRKKLASKKINLPVATSDLGDDWTSDLAKNSDYIIANIHPFFASVPAEIGASWTWTFWEGKDGPFWKSDKSKNIIAETGWPSAGGKNCGQAQTCQQGSVAGIDEMNRFMEDWVCQALKNGTQYFWFEAFDEPWKIRFNEKGKEWEDKWGLMDSSRKLKDGIKIPDCGGKTV